MRRTALHLLGVLTGCAVGLSLGFSAGQRQGFRMGVGALETEVNGTLSIHVEAASCIRVGDTERALSLLDGSIDAAVLSLLAQPSRRHPDTPLRQASLYRRVVPPTGAAAGEVLAALESVPPMTVPAPDPSSPPRSGLVRLARGLGG